MLNSEEIALIKSACIDEAAFRAVMSIIDTKVDSKNHHIETSYLDKAFLSSLDAQVIYNDDMHFISANPAALDLFGYAIDEFTQLNWTDVIEFASDEEIEILTEQWAKQTEIRGELTIVPKDDSRRHIQFVTFRNIKPDFNLSIIKDLTAQKWLEKELVSTIDSLKQFQALAHLGTWRANLSKNIVTLSSETIRMCGLEPTQLSISFEEALALYHPEDLPNIQPLLQKSKPEKPIHTEARLMRPDGEVRWVIVQGQLDIENGDRILNGTFIDITDRKIAELELQASKDLYQSLVNSLPMNVYRVDTEGHIIYANQHLLDDMQISLDDIVGKTAYDFYPQELADKYRRDDQFVMLGNDLLHIIEENISPVTGFSNYVETFKIPIKDHMGRIIGIQGVFRDVTDREQTQKALRESEARARALLEAIPDVMFHLRQDGTFLDGIADTPNLTVSTVTDLLDGRVSDFFSPELTALVMDHIEKTIRTGDIQTFEYDLEIPDRGSVDYEARMVKINDEEVYTIVRDVTQQKHATQLELQHELDNVRGEVLNHFIRSASHEFKTPLSIIGTSLYLMSRSDDIEYQQSKIEHINKQIERLTSLIDTQLTVVKLNYETNLARKPLPFAYVLYDAVEHIRTKYENIPQFDVDAIPDKIYLLAHEEYLKMALCHILDNAYRFTHDNTAPIDVGVSLADNLITVTVKDRGVGISEEALKHVFEMFWREDQSHTLPGFGLGLSIAKQIVELHQGQIYIQSMIDVGTTVTIVLPIHSASNA